MRILIFFFSIVCATAASLFAYEEWSLPNLIAPTSIKPLSLEVQFQHQFLGRIDGNDAFERFFGIGDGADGCITLRSVVWSTAQVYASYDNIQTFNQSHNEFSVGAAYAIAFPWLHLHSQFDGQIFSYASFLDFPEKRYTNFFTQLSLQNDPILDRVIFIVNGGYDFDKSRFGLGLGLDMKIISTIDLFGTLFPIVDGLNDTIHGQTGSGRASDSFSFGVKITTAGHQFFLTLSNATEIGARHLMRGITDNNLKFGFMLKRLFSF